MTTSHDVHPLDKEEKQTGHAQGLSRTPPEDKSGLIALINESERVQQGAQQQSLADKSTGGNELEDMLSRYLGLNPDKAWLEIIDGQHHELGPEVFDQALHTEDAEETDKEPGYLESALAARKYGASTLGQKMNSDMYLKMHALATAHKHEDQEGFHAGYRTEKDDEVHAAYGAIDEDGGDYVPGKHIPPLQEIDPAIAKAVTDPSGEYDDPPPVSEWPATKEGDAHFALWYLPKTQQQVAQHAEDIFGNYYASLEKVESHEDKLHLIATAHRQLENLHAFMDGTSRTNRIVLHKMLVENGMTPTILDKPTLSPLRTNQEWAEEIELGMAKWQSLQQAQ